MMRTKTTISGNSEGTTDIVPLDVWKFTGYAGKDAGAVCWWLPEVAEDASRYCSQGVFGCTDRTMLA